MGIPPWMGGGLPDGAVKGDEEEEAPQEATPPEERVPEMNPFYQVYRYYSSKTEDVDEKTVNSKPSKAKLTNSSRNQMVPKTSQPVPVLILKHTTQNRNQTSTGSTPTEDAKKMPSEFTA